MKQGLFFFIYIFFLLYFFNHQQFSLFALNELGSPYFSRSPSGLLMGDAVLASDLNEQALFYNPALLGRNKGIHLFPINLSLSATDVRSDLDQFKNLPSDPQGVSDRILGYPVHLQAATTPGMQIYHFGFQYLYQVQLDALLNNTTHPLLDLDYRYDNGFITGFGAPVYRNGCGTLSLGVGVKYIRRQGLRERYPLVGTTVLNLLSQKNLKTSDIFDTLGTTTAKTWGTDLGMDYYCDQGLTYFASGLSFLDIFTKYDIPDGKTLPGQPMTVNWGNSAGVHLGFLKLSLSLDVTPINLESSPAQLIHLGAKIGTPFISLLAGRSPSGFSYGASANLFLVEVMAGFYHDRLGTSSEPIIKNRAIIYVSLLDFSFDGP